LEDPALSLTTTASFSNDSGKASYFPKSPCSPESFQYLDIHNVLVPKALVIASKQPLFQTYEKILLSIYKISKKTLTLPMECYIAHLILQIPMPSRGHVTIRYLLSDYTFSISLPPLNKLPVLDLKLETLFSSLDIDNLLLLFRNILLEKSTVFISSDEKKLSYCTYAIISLLFPFHWNMVYVPVLPAALLDYLYSPVTFIFGVHSNNIEEIYSRVSDSVCLVDLDNNKFLISTQVSFHRKTSRNVPLPKLPDHYGKKLRKKLISTLGKNGNVKPKSSIVFKTDMDDTNNISIRSHFYQFFVSILRDYKKFMIYERKDDNSCFNNHGFVHNSSDKEFMAQFVETQMFSNFCESRVRPKNVEEHCECLFFDEEIDLKNGRLSIKGPKPQAAFINDLSQDHHSIYTVPAIESIFKSSKTYNYTNFPDSDPTVFNEIELPSTKPPKYTENIEKSPKVPPNWRTDSECLLTSYMDLWGLFIPYQDKSEHTALIQDLISVSEQLQHSTSLPTVSLYKYLLERCYITQPSLALPIFTFMNTAKIGTDGETLQLLQKIVSKLNANEQSIVMLNTGTNLLITQTRQTSVQENKIKRMFTKPEDTQIFAKQEVSFIIKETCKNCGKILKVDELSQRWSKINYKYESSCIGCNEPLLVRMTVRIGLEIGYYKHQTTSMNEHTLLISPQALRQLVADLILSHKNLDLLQFRTGYPMIFWNAIWYFYKKKLPFDFLLLYDREDNSPQLLLTIDDLQGNWEVQTAEKSVQTDLNIQDIYKAEEKYSDFMSLLGRHLFI
jgi:DENN (AEX-3) domain/dDENN domain